VAAVIIILGALQILGGVLAFASAASAIHQILGAVMFGMGVVSLGVGVLVDRIDKVGANTGKQLKIFEDRLGPKPS